MTTVEPESSSSSKGRVNGRVVRLVGAATVTLLTLCLASPAVAAPSAEKRTEVNHRFKFVLIAPDDICGPYPGRITFRVRTELLHWTEEADGRFNVQYLQTGTYHLDFDDPARPDQDSQYTESVHHVFTPGRTEVFNEAFHDFPDGIKIWERTHVTVVAERLVVERILHKDVGCP